MKRRPLTPRAIPAIVVGLLGVGGFLFLPGYLLYAGSTALVTGLVGLALVIPFAALREMPFHTAAMVGLSAYLFTYYGSHGNAGDHLTGIALGLGAVLCVALLGGLASLAVTGLSFVVVTLVIQIAVERVVFTIPGLTLGRAGRGVWQPLDHGWLDSQRSIFLVTALVVLACGLAVGGLFRSQVGYRLVLVGHAPEGAWAVGLRNWLIKLAAMVGSGLLLAVAGVMVAFVNGTPPTPFSFIWVASVVYLAVPIAAGMRELSAIWLVAATFTVGPILIEPLHIHPFFISATIVLSALLLNQSRDRIAARLRRFAPVLEEQRGSPEARPGIRTGPQIPAPPIAAPASSAPQRRAADHEIDVLEGEAITVDFGGLRAVDSVTVVVPPGGRVGVVGANGAGKTTLLNVLTGFVPARAGTVRLAGRDITGWTPMARARAGINRSFQFPRLADVLTAEQNVMAVHGYDRRAPERVDWLFETFGLADRRTTPAGALSFGQRRKLELIRALATKPQVLLLDEPTGGLMDDQAEKLVEVLLGLQALEGWGLLAVEHNPKVVTALSDHLLVMENGRLVAQGSTDVTFREDEVRRVYLGSPEPTRTSSPVRSAGADRPEIPAADAASAAAGLHVRDLHLAYGPMPVLRGVDLDCTPGRIVGVVGGNGVGKTSLLLGIAGLVRTQQGTVQFDGQDLTRSPAYRRAKAGVVMIAERRRVMPSLSVRDNLRAGGWGLDRDEVEARVARVLELFPRLAERERVPSYRLSGGEQRMVSIGRALVTDASCFLFDEFSLSLTPRLVRELTGIIRTLADDGRCILLVEQYLGVLLEIADTAHVLENGRFGYSGPIGEAESWLEHNGYLAHLEPVSQRL
ncbi:MAG: ATP-binding cassette domain-containing protein [Actinobacteria bacterium]|nr:ATP-binding cassette domain-containing protein [Actinomycetota bacterium]